MNRINIMCMDIEAQIKVARKDVENIKSSMLRTLNGDDLTRMYNVQSITVDAQRLAEAARRVYELQERLTMLNILKGEE